MSLMTLLRNLDRRIDVVVVADDPLVRRWFADHVPSARVEPIHAVRNKWDIRGMLALARTIRGFAPDIIHVNLQTPWSGKYAILAGRLLRNVGLVALEHTGMPPYNRRVVWAKKVLARMTSANVAVSADVAQFLETVADLRPGSVRVIYTGVPDRGPTPRLPRGTHPPVVGTVARLTAQKGVDVFLRALAQVPDAHGVVVGDGEDRVLLEQLATELAIDDRITWTGWRDDARTLISTFDVFVLASRVEGLGLALVEAALAQCPIVATNVGGTPEAVVDGQTGILVPPEDPVLLAGAIRSLLSDQDQASKLGERARLFALDRFDTETMIRAYESLYTDILEARRKRVHGGSLA